MNKLKNSALSDYQFYFNCFKQEWVAVKRGDWEKYINGDKFEGWKNKDINILIEFICKKDV